jgi:YcaO-like protein with predicted kinase domain
VLEAESVAVQLADDAAAMSGRSNPDKHSDRLRPAADTVGLLRGVFDAVGITRLARITHLDCVGIPVWSAIRPNALSLAVSQGKGISDAAAQASAVMEAVELAVTERSDLNVTVATPESLSVAGERTLPLKRLLRRGSPPISQQDPIAWVSGFDLLTNAIVKVPYEAARMDFTIDGHDRRSTFLQSSDGLASGNILLEAVVHGICERIERDACTLWSFRSASDIARSCVDPVSLADTVVDDLCRQIGHGGLRLRLFDITSDVGVPVFFAAIAPEGPAGTAARHLEISSGSGCHPSPARAAIRAITEAVQSRLTFIAGARDDFHPRLYAAEAKQDLRALMNAHPQEYRTNRFPPDRAWDGSASGCLDYLLDRLRERSIDSVVAVPLGGEDLGVAVARMFIPALEDPVESSHWRPGPRGFRAMLGIR